MAKTTKRKADFVFHDRTLRSAKGTARWAYLNKPDDTFGEPKHKITVIFDKSDPEFKKMVSDLKSFTEDFYKSKGKKAPKDAMKFIKTDDETGQPMIQFAVKAQFDESGKAIPIPVVDASKKPAKVPVWGGDTVRVAYTPAGWTLASGAMGVKLFLKGVQLLVSTAPDRQDVSSVFDVEEDFATDIVDDGTEDADDFGDFDDVADDDVSDDEDDLL